MNTRIALFLSGCMLSASLHAQTEKKSTSVNKDTLIQRDLIMEREYQPSLGTAEKQTTLPDLEPPVVDKQPKLFSITETPTPVQGDYNPLPPAGIQIPYPASNEFGYLRLGVGSHRSFLGDAQFNLLRKSKQSIDLSVLHRSVFGDLTNTAGETRRSYSNRNNVVASYKLHTTSSEIDASISEQFNAWNYYGTWRTAPLLPGSLEVPGKQWSSDSRFGFGIRSKDAGQPLSWFVTSEGHRFRLGNGVASAGSTAHEKGALEKEFNTKAGLTYDLDKTFHLGIDATMRSFSYRSATGWLTDEKDFISRRWLEFHPYGSMIYKGWMLQGGLRLSVPTLESERVKANLTGVVSTVINEKTIFKASLDGGVQPGSYREGFETNPYLDPAVRIKSSWNVLDINACLDYHPTSHLRLCPMVGYDVSKDAPFFYNGYPNAGASVNDAYGSLFSVQYMNSNRFRMGINGLYSYGSMLTLQGELYLNNYMNFSTNKSVDDLLSDCGRKAWYQPGMEMRLRTDFSPADKWSFFFRYELQALRYAPDNNVFCKRMDAINDLSLGTNYKLTKDVGVFLHINNLLDQRYQVWNAFPVHGFTAVLGGAVHF